MTMIGVTREEVLVEVAEFMQDEVIEDLPRADLRAGVAIEVEVDSLLDDLDAVFRDRNVVVHSVAVQPGDAEAYAHQPLPKRQRVDGEHACIGDVYLTAEHLDALDARILALIKQLMRIRPPAQRM